MYQLTAEMFDRLDTGTATANDQKAAADRLRQDIAAFRAIVQVLDGSQLIDPQGALIVARHWIQH